MFNCIYIGFSMYIWILGFLDIRQYVRWILFQTQDGEYCREPSARSYRQEVEELFQLEEQIM